MRLPDLNDLIQDLQLAKQMAIEDNNPNALIMATIGQAKLLGIDKPIKDVTLIRDVEPQQTLDYSMLSDDELRQLIAITEKVEKAVLDKRIEHARNEY
ncbi:hypothetical protein [Psychrobacter sp. DAB_AL32B]|uniref:hypothetical protein n=1 Tax=Psychrobacter sp. DAB_AL32B TaxID=1028414 RepID=UPI000B7F0EE5|nr:hypothetical protein [Psychrobacter sp. DAB_AL32B]OXL24614.1 hypothetical protein CAN34_05530 [Psychrobacter sp. DAB_AL32B]